MAHHVNLKCGRLSIPSILYFYKVWYALLKFWLTVFSGSIWLCSANVNDRIRPDTKWLTFDVRAVNPAEFSEVCRPDWGPGFGFLPFENASKTAFVVMGVRSSCA